MERGGEDGFLKSTVVAKNVGSQVTIIFAPAFTAFSRTSRDANDTKGYIVIVEFNEC
jgi:hypothetical protein